MPFVRCKFYTESGEPVRGGCHKKNSGCAFIHPGDPNWNNAPPPSFRPRDKSGDFGRFKSWGSKRSDAAPSGRVAGGNAGTGTADTAGGQDNVTAWGDVSGRWGDESGWGDGSGWGNVGGSTSTSNQGPEPSESNNPFTTKSGDTFELANQANTTDTAGGNTKSSKHGWGGVADKAMGSGWGTSTWESTNETDKASGSGTGNTGNDGWGASGWGNTKDVDKAAGSSGGASWGNNKDKDRDAGSGWGSAWNSGWGMDNRDTTNSWAAPEPMNVNNQAGKETERNKGRGKAVPAPPRIRIPDENKKTRITGTNNEPLGPSMRGELRSSILVTTSTPVTTTTPVTTLTPTDSSRLKRKRDVAFDDKFDVFREYVRAWERGVRARFLLAEAEAKRDRWFRTQKSACYARIGEAGRKRLDGQRAERDKEVTLQGEKLSGAITSLVKFHETFSSNLDLGQRYNIGEQAEKFIAESKAFVDQVRALLVERVLKDKNDVQPGDTQKRPSRADANITSVDSLRSKVRDLDERFEQTQTELTLRHQRDIRPEIDELLTTKIAALRMARQREIDRVASQPRPEIIIPPNVLGKIEGTAKQVRELDAKVPQTVEEIRVLLLRVDATTQRVSKLEEELSMNKATYSKVQQMAAEKQETERRIDERLEKIREQFEQLVAMHSPGPVEQPAMSPTIRDSRSKLMESLRVPFEALLDNFYEREIRPAINSLQQIVIQASDRHQEEAIRVLWGKIQPAMNMVAGVSRWLDSQELGLTAPVETDHTYAAI